MNINRVIKQSLLMLMLLVFGFNVCAETDPYQTFETSNLKIKLANDGTGVVTGIHCSGCGYNIVKITKDSRFTSRGVEVGVAETQERAGKSAMVSFTPETQEVQFIRW
jgi:hypothetical protein